MSDDDHHFLDGFTSRRSPGRWCSIFAAAALLGIGATVGLQHYGREYFKKIETPEFQAAVRQQAAQVVEERASARLATLNGSERAPFRDSLITDEFNARMDGHRRSDKPHAWLLAAIFSTAALALSGINGWGYWNRPEPIVRRPSSP